MPVSIAHFLGRGQSRSSAKLLGGGAKPKFIFRNKGRNLLVMVYRVVLSIYNDETPPNLPFLEKLGKSVFLKQFCAKSMNPIGGRSSLPLFTKLSLFT